MESEFNLVASKFDESFPKYIDWNYGGTEQFFKKNNDIKIQGGNILIGNNATFTNNHIEIFNILKKINLYGRKIICPLSYGNKSYGDYIEKTGKKMFGESFIPIRNIMNKKEYINLISGCSHVIMNHIRQQAGGNIAIMIFLGAKVFLDSRNPFFNYYKKMGIKVYSIKQINSWSMKNFLDKKSINKNRSILQKKFKEKSCLLKTENLIKKLLDEN